MLFLVVCDQIVSFLVLRSGLATNNRWLPLGGASSFVAAVVLIAAWFISHKKIRLSYAWVCMAGGLISNGLTYALRKGVVDYIPFGAFTINVADCLIMVGIGWLIYIGTDTKKAPLE
jgi:lipoprotein signal peptidase